MSENLFLVNGSIDDSEEIDVGGDLGCIIACVGGCLISQMVAAHIMVAVIELN